MRERRIGNTFGTRIFTIVKYKNAIANLKHDRECTTVSVNNGRWTSYGHLRFDKLLVNLYVNFLEVLLRVHC